MQLCKRRIFAASFRLIGMISGLAGLFLSITNSTGFMCKPWVFFTIQTNIFSTILFGVLFCLTIHQIFKDGKKGEVAHINLSLQLAITYYITITLIFFWVILTWYANKNNNFFKLPCLMVHGVVPLLAITDWILFMPHGKLNKKCAAQWLIYPILYYIYTIIRAQIGGPLYKLRDIYMMYPYYFIEPQCLGNIGWLFLILPIAIIVLYFMGRAYIYLDNRIYKILNK